jgi:hypothetical protein
LTTQQRCAVRAAFSGAIFLVGMRAGEVIAARCPLPFLRTVSRCAPILPPLALRLGTLAALCLIRPQKIKVNQGCSNPIKVNQGVFETFLFWRKSRLVKVDQGILKPRRGSDVLGVHRDTATDGSTPKAFGQEETNPPSAYSRLFQLNSAYR